jgi:hypothetical protein
VGSTHHVIQREKAALAFVHLSLVPLFVVDLYRAAFSSTAAHFASSHVPVPEQAHKLASLRESARAKPGTARPGRFGSEVDRRGREKIGMTEVREWDIFAEESIRLLGKFDNLVKEMKEAEFKPRDIEGFKGMGNGNVKHSAPVAQASAKGMGL